MNAPTVETVSTGADKAKLAAAGLLLVGAVAAFYLLSKQDLWLRVVALLALVAVAVAVFFTSEPGKSLVAFGRDSVRRSCARSSGPDPQRVAADDGLCLRLRGRDGAVPVVDRQDARVGAVRRDPGVEALSANPERGKP